MKNILIYKLNKQTKPIVQFLSKSQNISFYIAITHQDFLRLTNRIKPEIILLSDEKILDKEELKKILELNTHSVTYKIYSVEENNNSILKDLRSDIKIKFMELLS